MILKPGSTKLMVMLMTLLTHTNFSIARSFSDEMTGTEIASILEGEKSRGGGTEIAELLVMAEAPSSFFSILRNMRLALDRNLLIDPDFYTKEMFERLFGRFAKVRLYSRNHYVADLTRFGDSEFIENMLRKNEYSSSILGGSITYDFEKKTSRKSEYLEGDISFLLSKKKDENGLRGHFFIPPERSNPEIDIAEIRNIFGENANEEISYFNSIEWSKEAVAEAMEKAEPGIMPFVGRSAPATNERGNKSFTFHLKNPARNATIVCSTYPDGTLHSVIVDQTEK